MSTSLLSDLGFASLATSTSTFTPPSSFGFDITTETVMLFAIGAAAIITVVWLMQRGE